VTLSPSIHDNIGPGVEKAKDDASCCTGEDRDEGGQQQVTQVSLKQCVFLALQIDAEDNTVHWTAKNCVYISKKDI
jgi:hypothetical protein